MLSRQAAGHITRGCLALNIRGQPENAVLGVKGGVIVFNRIRIDYIDIDNDFTVEILKFPPSGLYQSPLTWSAML